MHILSLLRTEKKNDFEELIEVMMNDSLTEFQYVIENGEWIVVKK